MADSLFGREQELHRLRMRLQKRDSFLVHGPAGVGKTLLLKRLLPEFPKTLYCPESTTTQAVFRNVAGALVEVANDYVLGKLGKSAAGTIKAKSAVAVKGIVLEALRTDKYCVILDHLGFTSQSFSAAIKQVVGWTSTPVIAVARSAHMEDLGFLLTLFPERSDKVELRNFEPEVALQFAQDIAERTGLSAENISEFLTRIVELSEGNPGAIISMMELARQAKYRTNEHIKIAPLYVDFRMRWSPASRG